MADLNHVTLIGRLTRDAELKYTSNGFAISNFSLAVNRRRKNGEQWVDEVSFFDINLYGKSAESLKQYLVKGKQIAVDGELRQDRWEQDGQARSKIIISANNVQLLGGNAGASQDGSSNNYSKPNEQSTGAYKPKYEAPQGSYDPGSTYNGSDADFPEDIPF